MPEPLAAVVLDAEMTEATFYHSLWRSSDIEIERADLPRWSQSDFAASAPGMVVLKSNEANASGFVQANAAEMLRRRGEVASRILDQRMMTLGNHVYATLRTRSKVIGQADATMNSLSTGVVAIPTGAGNAPAGDAAKNTAALAPMVAAAPIEFRYGYVILADSAFFTLRQQNAFELSLRRFRMLTSALDAAGFGGAPTFLSVTKYFQESTLSPTLTYAVHAPSVEFRLTKSLSPLSDASVSMTHDFRLQTDRAYFTLAYRF